MQNHSQKMSAQGEPRLLDRIRNKCRLLHYSIRTESAFIDWVTWFRRFHRPLGRPVGHLLPRTEREGTGDAAASYIRVRRRADGRKMRDRNMSEWGLDSESQVTGEAIELDFRALREICSRQRRCWNPLCRSILLPAVRLPVS